MIDPYLYPNTNIFKNKANIKDQKTLDQAEADYTAWRLKQLIENPLKGNFDFEHLYKMNYHIFQDLYEWAGQVRTIDIEKPERALNGLSIEYTKHQDIKQEISTILTNMNAADWNNMQLNERAKTLSKHMAALWKAHPFREGNTRTIVTFCSQFAQSKGISIDISLFQKNSPYMRSALVAATAIFTDLGDKSRPEYLCKIVKDAMNEDRGLEIDR